MRSHNRLFFAVAVKIHKEADIFHPKNALKYLKVLSSDENMRRILSAEFQALIEAAKKTRSKLDPPAIEE